MTNYSLSSDKVAVFPAVGRTNSYPGAYTTTEENLIRRLTSLYSHNNGSFVITNSIQPNQSAEFVIHGYYFSITMPAGIG